MAIPMEIQRGNRAVCELCGGLGWVQKPEMVQGRYGLQTKIVRCSCQREQQAERRQEQLESLDGLTAAERKRLFDTVRPFPTQQAVYSELRQIANGICTLQGPPGTGKTHMLHCVVNQARNNGRVAVYSTMTDILDYLRATFNPDGEAMFDRRWRLLLECDVLAIDELDEFNATAWAKERFLRLIDERWRNRDDLLTLLALNGKVETLLPKVASRVEQGKVFRLEGADLRKVIR